MYGTSNFDWTLENNIILYKEIFEQKWNFTF